MLASAGKPCHFGTDPAKYLCIFEEWYEHSDLLADSMGCDDAGQKLKLLLLWGGREFRLHAKAAGVDETSTLKDALVKIRAYCGQYVNLSMAMFKLMHASQQGKSVTEFTQELEELATQCQFTSVPYTKERAMKDAFIFGTSDEKLRQEALAKDPDYKTLLKTALSYEQSRRSSGAIKMEGATPVQQVSTCSHEEVADMVARLVTRGKYCTSKPSDCTPSKKPQQMFPTCANCPPHYRRHAPGKCPARGKTCVVCGRRNHFVGSRNCSKSQITAVQAVDADYQYDDSVGCISVGMMQNSRTNMADVFVNGVKMRMMVDSGCQPSLLPVHMLQEAHGRLQSSTVRLRPYGTAELLDVIGEIDVTLRNQNGGEHGTKVYVVDGHLTEPLLGESDARALGILTIHSRGTVNEDQRAQDVEVAGIIAGLRNSGVSVKTRKEEIGELTVDEDSQIQHVVMKHSEVFEGIGLLKDVEVTMLGDPNVEPVAAPYRPVPLAYQARLSKHLQELREADKIEDVGPEEHCTWISNVVITEKKNTGKIRMSVDMRDANRAIKRTPRHVTTVQEMRHKLAGATVFSELDMSHGFHQLKLAESSRHFGTFRTHEGLHRFKVLFFGAAPASDIFHTRISEALAGLDGCMSIHDNILVWGKTPAEHVKNLEACLQRLKERGLTLRKEKCNFGKREITWFGWTFTSSGMSADQRKVEAIKQAGRPESTDDVKSFLQACQYNAKFMFATQHAYSQVTWPLRQLTCKGAKFIWSEDCERAYQEILQAMTREDALRPFDPKLPTKLVTDAGPDGLAASLFQELPSGEWIPVDHASRALTKCEQRYSQFEKESLAQAWGMQVHRNYLLGIKFDSYTDHKPLLPVYNGLKKGNARVERHKLRTQDFQFTMRHVMGKDNPCDYASRHPRPLDGFTREEQEAMILDLEDEICINRIIEDDLPDAVTLQMLQEATKEDPVSQRVIRGLHRGYFTKDPEMQPFRHVLHELTYVDGVLLRGERLYIPDAAPMQGTPTLRQRVVEIAHEGHQGIDKTKRMLRSKCWFPLMDKMVEDKVNGCLACQATTYMPTRDPLKPTPLPQRAWQRVAADFWGPLPTGEHLLVVIDEYSRYPEVEICSGTSSKTVIPHLDKIFSTHGIPEVIKTDGGPPFNGYQFKQYVRWMGVAHRTVSPEDPEANGLAEAFMKVLKKTWCTANTESRNPRQEMYRMLRQYRATPHCSTQRAPAEVLFNRPFRTRLPEHVRPTSLTGKEQEMQEADKHAKAHQKRWKDRPRNVVSHKIQVGDEVLLLQQAGKTEPRYDPRSYKVLKVIGTQITVKRGEKVITRDAQRCKKVKVTNNHSYRRERSDNNCLDEWYPTIETANGTNEGEGGSASTNRRREAGTRQTGSRESVETRAPSAAAPNRRVLESGNKEVTGSQVAVPGNDTIEADDGGVLVRPVRIRKVPAYLRDYVRE